MMETENTRKKGLKKPPTPPKPTIPPKPGESGEKPKPALPKKPPVAHVKPFTARNVESPPVIAVKPLKDPPATNSHQEQEGFAAKDDAPPPGKSPPPRPRVPPNVCWGPPKVTKKIMLQSMSHNLRPRAGSSDNFDLNTTNSDVTIEGAEKRSYSTSSVESESHIDQLLDKPSEIEEKHGEEDFESYSPQVYDSDEINRTSKTGSKPKPQPRKRSLINKHLDKTHDFSSVPPLPVKEIKSFRIHQDGLVREASSIRSRHGLFASPSCESDSSLSPRSSEGSPTRPPRLKKTQSKINKEAKQRFLARQSLEKEDETNVENINGAIDHNNETPDRVKNSKNINDGYEKRNDAAKHEAGSSLRRSRSLEHLHAVEIEQSNGKIELTPTKKPPLPLPRKVTPEPPPRRRSRRFTIENVYNPSQKIPIHSNVGKTLSVDSANRTINVGVAPEEPETKMEVTNNNDIMAKTFNSDIETPKKMPPKPKPRRSKSLENLFESCSFEEDQSIEMSPISRKNRSQSVDRYLGDAPVFVAPPPPPLSELREPSETTNQNNKSTEPARNVAHVRLSGGDVFFSKGSVDSLGSGKSGAGTDHSEDETVKMELRITHSPSPKRVPLRPAPPPPSAKYINRDKEYDASGYLQPIVHDDLSVNTKNGTYSYADVPREDDDDVFHPRSRSLSLDSIQSKGSHIYESVGSKGSTLTRSNEGLTEVEGSSSKHNTLTRNKSYDLALDDDTYSSIQIATSSDDESSAYVNQNVPSPARIPPNPPPRNRLPKDRLEAGLSCLLDTPEPLSAVKSNTMKSDKSDDYIYPENFNPETDSDDDNVYSPVDFSKINSAVSSPSSQRPLSQCSSTSSGSTSTYFDMSNISNISHNTSNASSMMSEMAPHHSDTDTDTDEPNEEINKEKREKKIKNIATEIMSSEKVFVDVLHLINIDFRRAVADGCSEFDQEIIPSSMLNQILNNLPSLYNFNKTLSLDLNSRIDKWESNPKVADIFVTMGPFLKLYTSYIRDYEKTTTLLETTKETYPHFATVVKNFESSPKCAHLAINHYMLKPIQRIPQYKLLLSDYLKHLPEDHPDYDDTIKALEIVTEVANHANDGMKQGEHFQKLLEIQNSIEGQFEVIKPGRLLIKQGVLLKLSRKEMQQRNFFLFNDVLLYTTPLTMGYKLNHVLPLTGMKVSKPAQEDFANEFSIYSTQRSFSISASSPQERDEWLSALTGAIQNVMVNRRSFRRSSKRLQDQIDKVTNKPDFKLGSRAPIWIPDARVTMCMLCTSEFTVTWRRHHCRACGKVTCGSCSDNKAPLLYLKYKAVRVCDECFESLSKEFEEKGPEDTSGIEEEEELPSEATLSKTSIKSRFRTFNLKDKGNWKILAKKKPSVLREVHANDSGATMSGYLKVFKAKGKWKKMWYVLKDKVMYTYKASEDTAAMESLPLLGFQVNTFDKYHDGVQPNLVFELKHNNKSYHIFKTESPPARDKWLKAMQEAVEIGQK
ncbi:unnamed protein product [Owenia fusiformis]|uniref:Uncharacterized protein n=1 Tax=Owenia fusiformis TaxID=6347 RepID=A0A8J1T6J3_OWEFU|nr:unnamed protein product [Owenia fusiformis]